MKLFWPLLKKDQTNNCQTKIVFALCAILVILGLFACEKARQENTLLIIQTPVQGLNSINNTQVKSMTGYLSRVAKEFAQTHANVKPKIKTFNYVDEMEAIAKSINTSEAPDILFGLYFDLLGYLGTRRVVPLDTMFPKAIWDDFDPQALKVSGKEGKIYIMPFLSIQNILIYNKDLFQKCGLEKFCDESREVRNWSIEDWNTILDTLARQLPEGEYPLAMYGKNNRGDSNLMTFLRMFGGRIFNSKGNFDFQEDRVVKALTWLQNGVRKGWYPPNAASLELDDCRELFANGQLAICMFNANHYLYDNLENIGFVRYPGNLASFHYNGFIVFDNGNPKKLDAARDFLTHIYKNEKWLNIADPSMPLSGRVLKKYKDQPEGVNEFEKNSINLIEFMYATPNWYGREDSVRNVFWRYIHELLELKITPEQCARKLDDACNNAMEAGKENLVYHQ